jgi:hypothetical protein
MPGKSSTLLACSMIANVALATWCLIPSTPANPVEEVVPIVQEEIVEAEPVPESPPEPRYSWSWKDVWQNGNSLEELSTKLRELECPDYVVTVALEHAINETFAERELKLWTIGDFWLTAEAQEALIVERRRALWLLVAEKRAVTTEATGIDWASRLNRDSEKSLLARKSHREKTLGVANS